MGKRRRQKKGIPPRVIAVLVGAVGLIALSLYVRGLWGGEGPVLAVTVNWPAGEDVTPELDWRPLRTSPGFKKIGGGRLRTEDGRLMRVANGWRAGEEEKTELARMRLVPIDPTHAHLEIETGHEVRWDGPADGSAPPFRILNSTRNLPTTLEPGTYQFLLERIPPAGS